MGNTNGRVRIDFHQLMTRLQAGETRLDDLEPAVVVHVEKIMNESRDALQARFDTKVEQELNAPNPGDVAPDFELELLDHEGRRTGDQRCLSDYYDKPVALIFGSFT